MGKINVHLKRLFITFNAIFAAFGVMMIYGLVKYSAYGDQLSAVGSQGVGWVWAFALGVLGTSCLGIYAGHSEKPIVLKTFAGFMGVGMVVMMIFGIITATEKDQMKASFQNTEMVKMLLQSSDMGTTLNELQREVKCCGVTSASDWGDVIPYSCACSAGYGSYSSSAYGCKDKPEGSSGPNQIYEEPCINYLFAVLDQLFSVSLGVFFGFAVVALLGLLISLLMIHQVQRHNNSAACFDLKGY